MYKRIIVFILCIFMLLSTIGCGNETTDNQEVDPNDFSFDFGDDGQSVETDSSKDDKDSVNSKDDNKTSSKVSNSSSKNQNTSSMVSSNVSVDYSRGEFVSSTSSQEEKKEYVTFIELPSLENVNKLSNSLNILKEGKELKVVYYGGSVTSGAGSSDATKKSWAALTTSYLKTFGKVNEVNKAIGGTGSFLGISRFQKDVIAQNPDLVFIEFVVNDGYSAIPVETSIKNLEYMIRTLNAHNSKVDIVIVLITNKDSFGEKGTRHNAFTKVAEHYNIPCVDLGIGFFNYIEGKKNWWLEYFADSVHPNNKGHKVYADIMQEALEKLLIDGKTSDHKLPDLLDKNGYSTVTNIFPDNINESEWGTGSWYSSDDYENPGTQFRSSHIKNYYAKYIYPKSSGASLTFKFTGNSLGLLGNIKEGSSLTVTIDGNTTTTVKGVSKSEQLEYPIFAGLENKEHTVTITANGKPPYLSIASFVIGK